jgi:hypothetical protein
MKSKGVVYIIGRGNIVLTNKENDNPLHINDKVKISNNIFEVIGIEHMEYSSKMGLILKPNPLVKEVVKEGDEIIKI